MIVCLSDRYARNDVELSCGGMSSVYIVSPLYVIVTSTLLLSLPLKMSKINCLTYSLSFSANGIDSFIRFAIVRMFVRTSIVSNEVS